MPVAEFLEKYLVAPSPSRDYYGIKVIRDQVILYTWKVSHGPHHASPIVKKSQFNDFDQDKIMHNEIQWVFGESMLQHVRSIAKNKTTLITLPKYLVKKIIGFLNFKDVLKLSTLSRMANEIFNGDAVWELLYKRQKMGLLYKDEREKGSSLGWKQLFKERQMHRPAKERKLRKIPSDSHIVVPRSSKTIKKETTSLATFKAYPKKTTSANLLLAEDKNPKSSGLKSYRNLSGRPNTANKKKSDTEAKRCELSVRKNVTGDGRASKKTKDQISMTSREIEKSRNLETMENKAKIVTKVTNFDDDKMSAKSIIGTRKKIDNKFQGSLKSNPPSVRRIEYKSESNSGSSNETVTKRGQKTVMINKTEKSPGEKDPNIDISIDDLIRESIIAENCLGSEIFDRYIRESSSIGGAAKKAVKKISKSNFLHDKNSSSIFEKFSTPRNPATVVQNREIVPERKFESVKSFLGNNKPNFDRGVKNPVDSRILPKIETCQRLDSKLSGNKSTRQFTLLKKREVYK